MKQIEVDQFSGNTTMLYEDSEALRTRCHKDITDELNRLYNDAQVDRRDLVETEVFLKNAESGAWKIINGQIVKGDKPVNASTLLFLSWCWKFVPALLKIVYNLEMIIIDLIAKRLSAKAEELRAKDALDNHREEIGHGQTTGPDHEFDLLVGCAKLGAITGKPLADLFRRWMAGHSIETEVLGEYTDALKRENELCAQIEGAPDRIKKYFRAYSRKQG